MIITVNLVLKQILQTPEFWMVMYIFMDRHWPTGYGLLSSARHSDRLALLPRWKTQRCPLRPHRPQCWNPSLWNPCAAGSSAAPCQAERQCQGSGWGLRSGQHQGKDERQKYSGKTTLRYLRVGWFSKSLTKLHSSQTAERKNENSEGKGTIIVFQSCQKVNYYFAFRERERKSRWTDPRERTTL